MKRAIAFVSLLAIASCGSPDRSKTTALAAQEGRDVKMGLLRSSVAFEGGDQALARIGSSWQALAEDSTGVTELKAGARGSIVRIGEATLWMRSGSHLRLGQDREGQLVLDLKKGQARLASPNDGLLIMGGKGFSMSMRDVLISHMADTTVMVATHMRPKSAAWSMELSGEPEQRGVGSLEVRQGDGNTPLQLRNLSVSVKIAGGMAITEVEHTFFNPSDSQMEGTFRFPAPDGVMVTGLAMEMNGRMMEGEFVERIKARQIYEEIVDQMQDPALLEWQQGGWFKLRVFPIEPQSEKRVVLRYAHPLAQSVEGYEYRYLATPPEDAVVGNFELKVNGKVAFAAQNLAGTQDVVLPFPESAVPAAVVESRGEYSYAALTLRPEWDAPYWENSKGKKDAKRRVVIAMDSSRSALENKQLSLELLKMVLAELGPKDEFALFAHDIAPRVSRQGFVAASAENIASALSFYSELELDGASDLNATLLHAASLVRNTRNSQVIYVGDGTPSWGKVKEEELAKSAQLLGKTPLFAAVLGRGASTSLWENLTGGKGGTVVRPHTALEAKTLAYFLANAPHMHRMEKVSIQTTKNISIFPQGHRTLFEGEEMTVLVRAPLGKMPAFLTANAVVNGTKKRIKLPIAGAEAKKVPGALVAQRFAANEIATLEAAGADKERIVEMSRRFGVMSKHTSLLVLESEEAYKKYQIERKKAEEERRLAANENAPVVSGSDLDNLDGREASLSPNHIQPGDPEIRIPAPADARSVVLIFPFGDTKIAHYDEESQSWIARFLISPETPDGEYWVRVRIEHADGSTEEMQLSYTVDTSAPEISLQVIKLRGKRYRFVVRQLEEIDAIRVEVALPGGQSQRMYRKREGLFRKVVRFPEGLGEAVKVKVVVTDKALNQRVVELEVPVEGL